MAANLDSLEDKVASLSADVRAELRNESERWQALKTPADLKGNLRRQELAKSAHQIGVEIEVLERQVRKLSRSPVSETSAIIAVQRKPSFSFAFTFTIELPRPTEYTRLWAG